MAGLRNQAERRYVLRVAVATAGYLGALFVAGRVRGRGEVTGPLAWVLALLPGLSVAGFFWAIGRLLIEEKDEYLRMLLVRQVLVATAFCLSLTTAWGFLENFGLVHHVDAYWVAILWFFGLGVGALVNRLTLGDAGGCA